MNIRAMTEADWPQVERIYQEGIDTGLATFETTVPAWEAWDRSHIEACRFVAERDAHLLGWAALSAVSKRYVYRGVAEVSVYVGADAQRQGVGSTLLKHLVTEAEGAGFWTLQGVILRKNAKSIALHEKCGFRVVGYRERIGFRDGAWHDTVLMERRSIVVHPESTTP